MACEGSLTLDGSSELLSEIRTMGWEKLLQNWRKLLDIYDNLKPYYEGHCEAPRDVAYWYGERTLTGLLAAAANKVTGGWALVEPADVKISNLNEAPRGWTDMWLGLAEHEFTVEAKLVEPEGTIERDVEMGWQAVNMIVRALRLADEQLDQLSCAYRLGYPMAVVYVVPGFKNTRPVRGGSMKQWFAQIAEALAKDEIFTATYLPHWGDRDLPTDKGKVYPGVIFVGRYRKDETGWPNWNPEREQWETPMKAGL